MTSFLFVAAFAIVCAGLGWPIVARCDRAGVLTVSERLAAAFVVGTLAIYLAVFAVGPFRLDRISMGVVSLAAVLLAIPGLRTIPWAKILTDIRAAFAAARRDSVTALLWLTALGIGASSFLQGFAPPNDYDSLMYHLAIPQLDVERGRIAPAWGHGLPNAFFPAGMHHLYRLALVFASGEAAQAIHGVFGLVAAVAAAAIARRMSAGPRTMLLAAAMFLAVRAVIWEMATAEVDVASAAWFALGLVVYLAWRERSGIGLLVLLGLTLGGGLLTKYHGGVAVLAIGALLLIDLARGRTTIRQAAVVPAVALTLFASHLILSFHLTGNPVFPLFYSKIIPGGAVFYDDYHLIYGTGRRLFDLLTAPFSFSVLPMHYYDGMVLGAPYLLAFAPLAVMARGTLRQAAPMLLATTVFYLIWFYLLGQQVRFLMAVFPVFAAFAAIGATALWQAAKPLVWGRALYVGLVGTLAINQFLFVGIYAATRLPVALGLRTPEAYHTRTPTMQGAAYGPCTYVRANLKSGERFLSLIGVHSYYCPQATAQLRFLPGEEKAWLRPGELRPIELPEFIAFFESNDFRFVIIVMATEARRNVTGEQIQSTVAWNQHRFGRHVEPAIRSLTPLACDALVAVYDGREVLAELRKLSTR